MISPNGSGKLSKVLAWSGQAVTFNRRAEPESYTTRAT
jgi:hypothetical protein